MSVGFSRRSSLVQPNRCDIDDTNGATRMNRFLMTLLLGSMLVLPTVTLAETKPDLASIKGRIQVVESFPDYKVKVVSSFADLHVEVVESFPDDAGEWQMVESFPDYKIQFVESFPDFTIKYVESFPGVQ